MKFAILKGRCILVKFAILKISCILVKFAILTISCILVKSAIQKSGCILVQQQLAGVWRQRWVQCVRGRRREHTWGERIGMSTPATGVCHRVLQPFDRGQSNLREAWEDTGAWVVGVSWLRECIKKDKVWQIQSRGRPWLIYIYVAIFKVDFFCWPLSLFQLWWLVMSTFCIETLVSIGCPPQSCLRDLGKLSFGPGTLGLVPENFL